MDPPLQGGAGNENAHTMISVQRFQIWLGDPQVACALLYMIFVLN